MIDFIKRILTKYREQIAYLFFGGLTTLISWGTYTVIYYWLFGETLNVLSNVIAEVIAITFAYVTNKLFVFRSKTNTKGEFFRELISFFALRAISFFLNLGAMWLLVDYLLFEAWICKIIVNVVVIILNYLFSKLFIFNKGKSNQSVEDEGDE